MGGQKCYKSEKQKQSIELLQRYWELLLSLQESLLSNQVASATGKMEQIELLLPKIQALIKDNTNEIFTADIQSLLLKIKELQQQIYDYSDYKTKKLKMRKTLKLIKKYYYSC